MKTATAHLKSVSHYSQSRPHGTPKLEKEAADDYERRTWRERCHSDDTGHIFIPGMAFKESVAEAAKFLGMKIPGRRNATYTKHFVAGVLVFDNLSIATLKDEVEPEWIYTNADGVKGSGKRVWRCFPLIREWEGKVDFHIADETITPDVFEQHLREAGKFIGIGRFRPRNGGFKGRFDVVGIEWN